MDEKIKRIFATILQVPVTAICDENTHDQIENWDSMNHLILIAGFEDEFSIDIEPEEIIIMYESFGKFKEMIIKKVES